MQIAGIPVTHLREGVAKEASAVENIGVFSKEAEDQPRHEMVHLMTAFGGAPRRVVFEQLYVEPVQAAGSADVKRVLANLFDSRNACQRQEKTEVVRELRVVADNRLATFQLLSLQRFAISGKHVLGLSPQCSWAGLEGRQCLGDLAGLTHRQVDIACLQYTAQI